MHVPWEFRILSHCWRTWIRSQRGTCKISLTLTLTGNLDTLHRIPACIWEVSSALKLPFEDVKLPFEEGRARHLVQPPPLVLLRGSHLQDCQPPPSWYIAGIHRQNWTLCLLSSVESILKRVILLRFIDLLDFIIFCYNQLTSQMGLLEVALEIAMLRKWSFSQVATQMVILVKATSSFTFKVRLWR